MSREPTDLLIAAYLYIDPAKLDYRALVDAGVKIEGAVCVSRDQAGELHLEDTDRLVGKSAEILGLFAPPVLLTTAVGTAIGGGPGELAHDELEEKINQLAGETIPFGGAGLIVAYPRSSADSINKAVTRAVKKAVGEADGKKLDALKKALADAQEKMKQPAGQAGG
jgi:uncharacterized membrane protein